MEFREAQARTWQNKGAKGFNLTDVPLEFGFLYREVSEAFTAWREGAPGLASELADIALFTAGLAEMNGIDLGQAVDDELAVNEARSYHRQANGVLPKEAEAE